MNKKCHTKAWLNKSLNALFNDNDPSAAVLFCVPGQSKNEAELSRLANADEFFEGPPSSKATGKTEQQAKAAKAAKA